MKISVTRFYKHINCSIDCLKKIYKIINVFLFYLLIWQFQINILYFMLYFILLSGYFLHIKRIRFLTIHEIRIIKLAKKYLLPTIYNCSYINNSVMYKILHDCSLFSFITFIFHITYSRSVYHLIYIVIFRC